MAMTTYFVLECPTCGRSLEIRGEYLGRRLSCRHCRGQFTANDPGSDQSQPRSSSEALLRRAEELLALAERSKTARYYPW